MKTFVPKFAYLLVVILFVAGCSGHVHKVEVSISGVPTTVAPNQVVTFTATVTGERKGNQGVTWAVNGAGTFTSTTTSLTYTAPATVPANPLVTVMATSIATPTAGATATFTIATAALSVQITNPINSVTVGSTTNPVIDATVTNDVNNQGVSWDLFTAGTTTECEPDCGTIVMSNSTSAEYQAPATVPANPSVSLVATSVADNTQSAIDTFTIQAATTSNLSFLNGNYAFEVSGFGDESDGAALTLAGSFVADGNGNITSGEIDVNDNFTVTNTKTSNTPVTGTYTLDSNLRGVITLAIPLNEFSNNATFAFTLDSATNTGEIISADPQEQAVSGTLAGQSAAVLSATPSGSFIFRGSSDAANIRAGMVGRFTIGSGGVISNGLVDSADLGNGNDSVDDTLTGTFTAADAAGRGTVQFNTDQSGLVAGIYAYYAVSPTKIYLITIDNEADGQFVAVARGQSSLSASSVNGTGVFGILGGDDNDDTAGPVLSSVIIGQMVVTGGNTVSVQCDLNDAGSQPGQCSSSDTDVVAIPGTVTFDPSTGRGTMTLPNGYSEGFVDSVTFYLENNGAGVLLDTTGFDDGSTLPEAAVGDLIPQTNVNDVAGQVQGLTLISEGSGVAVEGEAAIAGSGQTNGLLDASAVDEDPIFGATLTGPVSEVASTGRSTAQFTSNALPETGDFALFSASPTQFFLIGETSETDSPLGIFSSQTLPEVQNAVKAKSSASTARGPKSATSTRQTIGRHRTRHNAAKATTKTQTKHAR
ncbi:MAG TPA: hypothetical protein VGD60_15370 [Candidatus Acidoferrales bacterium]